MKWLKRAKISRQLYAVYMLTMLIPLTLVGLLLIFSARKSLSEYYLRLLEADNSRVSALLREVTTQAYNVSNQVCFNENVQRLLAAQYDSSAEFTRAASDYSDLETLVYNNDEIAKIYIYTDNPAVRDYRQFRAIDEEVAQTQWYQTASSSINAFWMTIPEESIATTSNNLSLVRRMNLYNSDYFAIVVVQLSDSYIRSRVDYSNIVEMVSVDDQGIVYGSSTSRYGEAIPVAVDHSNAYFRDTGTLEFEGKQYLYALSTINLKTTTSRMYVCTMDNSGVEDIHRLTTTWLLVLALAVIVPFLTITVYAAYFSGRINLLRAQMHKASRQDYDIVPSLKGNDELNEAFADLQIMVRDIKEKDARMYEAELNEQDLLHKQQLMKYKMLSSQINPHYLYNTLETIRMKALTTGDREVADAIKLLGKTLRYVQENTGVNVTTLQKELDHVQSYLSIQKLRFGERLNYRLDLEEGIDPENVPILPLMLQPVVENAVVHGLEGAEGIGVVRIHILQADGCLHIHIKDNGVGMSEQQLKQLMDGINAPELPRSSIALYNIHQRIRLRYGESYGVKVESVQGQGTRVCLRLPAQ